MAFVVVVESKKTLAVTGSVLSEEGQKYIAIRDDEGWVEASAKKYRGPESIGMDVKTFDSKEAAER